MPSANRLTKKFHEVVRDLRARDQWRAADSHFEDSRRSSDVVKLPLSRAMARRLLTL